MNPTEEETALWVALNLAQRAIHRSMETKLKKHKLPPLRWYDVLWELERSTEGVRPFELEQQLIFEQSNLSRLLRRMANEGLVKEITYDGDARGKVLSITEKGRTTREKMWQVYGPLIKSHMAKLSSEHDMKILTGGLTELGQLT